MLNFFVGIIVGVLLETIYRSKEAKRLTAPQFINVHMYGWMGIFLVFIYFLKLPLLSELILIFIIPTLMEFLMGYIYLKIKGVYLWTYFEYKFNFMGIICLRFSIYWFVFSAIYYYLFMPIILKGV